MFMDRVQDDFRRPLVRHFSGLSEYNYKAHTRPPGYARGDVSGFAAGVPIKNWLTM